MGTQETEFALHRLNQVASLKDTSRDKLEWKKGTLHKEFINGDWHYEFEEKTSKLEPEFAEILRQKGIKALARDLVDLGYGKEVESILHPQLPVKWEPR